MQSTSSVTIRRPNRKRRQPDELPTPKEEVVVHPKRTRRRGRFVHPPSSPSTDEEEEEEKEEEEKPVEANIQEIPFPFHRVPVFDWQVDLPGFLKLIFEHYASEPLVQSAHTSFWSNHREKVSHLSRHYCLCDPELCVPVLENLSGVRSVYGHYIQKFLHEHPGLRGMLLDHCSNQIMESVQHVHDQLVADAPTMQDEVDLGPGRGTPDIHVDPTEGRSRSRSRTRSPSPSHSRSRPRSRSSSPSHSRSRSRSRSPQRHRHRGRHRHRRGYDSSLHRRMNSMMDKVDDIKFMLRELMDEMDDIKQMCRK